MAIRAIPDDPAELGRLITEEFREALRAKFLPIAIIAEIPPGNVDEFLMEVWDYDRIFDAQVEGNRCRDQRRPAINGFMNAADRMIYAIERVQKYEKTEITEAADVVFAANFRLKGAYHPQGRPSLADIKRELTDLRDWAELFLMEFPKRGRNSTKQFLGNIWATAEKFGGGLTYDKKLERGTLTKVIEFFKDMDGWTKLSPSTLDRLRPRR